MPCINQERIVNKIDDTIHVYIFFVILMPVSGKEFYYGGRGDIMLSIVRAWGGGIGFCEVVNLLWGETGAVDSELS